MTKAYQWQCCRFTWGYGDTDFGLQRFPLSVKWQISPKQQGSTEQSNFSGAQADLTNVWQQEGQTVFGGRVQRTQSQCTTSPGWGSETLAVKITHKVSRRSLKAVIALSVESNLRWFRSAKRRTNFPNLYCFDFGPYPPEAIALIINIVAL